MLVKFNLTFCRLTGSSRCSAGVLIFSLVLSLNNWTANAESNRIKRADRKYINKTLGKLRRRRTQLVTINSHVCLYSGLESRLMFVSRMCWPFSPLSSRRLVHESISYLMNRFFHVIFFFYSLSRLCT